MKKTIQVLLLLLLMMTISSHAVDWNDRFGVGIRAPIYIPLFEGSDFMFFGDKHEPYSLGWDVSAHGRLGLGERLVADLSLGYISLNDDSLATGDQSFKFNGTGDSFTRLEGIQYRLVGNYFFKKDKQTQPYAALGFGVDQWRVNRRRVLTGDAPYIGTVIDFGLVFGGGVNFWLTKQITLDAQALFSYGLFDFHTDMPEGAYGPGDWSNWSDRPFHASLEPSLGLTYWFGGEADSDNDGVKDGKDQCPGTPWGAIVNDVGCPLDSDGDGVYDGPDVCPNTPKGATVDAKGCPKDSDKDGVFDGIDKCPNTPLGWPVDNYGCPLDDDRDGVSNPIDKCPNTPAGAKVDSVGCPLDTDKDGVPDIGDKCPDTPRNLAVDSVGCPLLAEGMVLSERVLYAFDSYVIRPVAKTILDSLVTVLKAYPHVKIDIRGYTDAIGSSAYNQTLSVHRANSVKQYLLDRGIAAGRMSVQGFGRDPKFYVAGNKTEEGRQRNRRVEIELVRKLQ